MTAAPQNTPGRSTGPAGTVPTLALSALLLLAGVAGHLAAPAGPLRALLVAPTLLWVPGRSLVAGLGLARSAERFTAALSVVFSCVALISAGLLCQLAWGHVPLAVLPLWLSTLLLPLNLRKARAPRAPLGRLLTTARSGLVFCFGTLATAAVLALVTPRLPTAAQSPYLSFYLDPPYVGTTGVLPVAAGQTLRIPVTAAASGTTTLPGGLTVAVLVDGHTHGTPVAVPSAGRSSAGATVTVRVPAGCEHQIRLELARGGGELRSLDLYVRARAGDCDRR